jgi:glycine hydroxymethyltransferase
VAGKKISATSIYFENMSYRLNEDTGVIDYDRLAENALLFRPKILVAGASAYSRNIDYKRMREIADSVGAYLMADMAHISGLVAAGVTPSPFEYADIVTTTTHKSLRGPRGAMIFFRKGVRSSGKKGDVMYDLEEKINFSVFPGHQGGPHNHTISGLAVALKQAMEPEFVDYQKQVVANCAVLASELQRRGIDLVSGGTDNHLILADLRSAGVDGARTEFVLERAHIAVNKNTVPGDKSALSPSGLRIGTPALTSRGMMEDDFKTVAELLHRGIEIAADVKSKLVSKKVSDFKAHVVEADDPKIAALRADVESFAAEFPTIGYEMESMRYR